MDGFTDALSQLDLPQGSMKTVVVRGKKVAIANVDGQVFAIADTCSHEECSLGSEGYLDGNVIICGCHGAQFDAASGKVLSLPATVDVASYQVKIDNGRIWVKA